MNTLKVVHIITGLGVGGAERSLANLCANTGPSIEHHVISLLPPGDMLPLLTANRNVCVYQVGMVRGIPSLGALLRLRRVIKAIQPDLIQGWMYHGNIAAILSVFFLHRKIPVCWNIRNSLYTLKNEKPLTRLIIMIHRALSRLPARIVYNSRLSKKQHERFGLCQKRAEVIPNGFSLSQFMPNAQARATLRSDLGIKADAILIGNVARLHPVKDHSGLLAALRPLMRKMPNLHVLFAGRNVEPLNSCLVGLFSQLPMDRVHCLGERSDVELVMPALDIYCSSSYAEAFPNALAEAMACGVPCVATDAGDSRHIVGSTGIIIPARDPRSLEQALQDMLSRSAHERLELGRLARERIDMMFSVPATVAHYTTLWLDVCDPHP